MGSDRLKVMPCGVVSRCDAVNITHTHVQYQLLVVYTDCKYQSYSQFCVCLRYTVFTVYCSCFNCTQFCSSNSVYKYLKINTHGFLQFEVVICIPYTVYRVYCVHIVYVNRSICLQVCTVVQCSSSVYNPVGLDVVQYLFTIRYSFVFVVYIL